MTFKKKVCLVVLIIIYGVCRIDGIKKKNSNAKVRKIFFILQYSTLQTNNIYKLLQGHAPRQHHNHNALCIF